MKMSPSYAVTSRARSNSERVWIRPRTSWLHRYALPSECSLSDCESRRSYNIASLSCFTASYERVQLSEVWLKRCAYYPNCREFPEEPITLSGSPVAYVPLSIHVPEYFQQLLDQQAGYAHYKAWWTARKPSTQAHYKSDDSHATARLNGPTLIRRHHECTTIQEDILNAISSPLTPQIDVPPYNPELIPAIKTSETHPLK